MENVIKSIEWNGRVMDTTHMGEKTGTRYVTERVEVREFGGERVEKIEEVNLTTYDVHYNKYGERSILRIFNPIEVLFIKK